MPDWLSIEELLNRWGIKDFQLLDHLRKGLQPYSRYGSLPIKCPSSYNRWYQVHRRLEDVESKLRVLDAKVFTPAKTALMKDVVKEGKENVRKKLLQEKEEASKAVKAFERDKEDEDPDSWKFLNLSGSEKEVEEVLMGLKDSLFKLADVEEYEKKFPKKPSTGTLEGKKLLRVQKHRIECRKVAKELWEKDPEMTIAAMIRRQEIVDVTIRTDGSNYLEKTVRNWIKDLCPNPKHGRPKKHPA